MALMVDGDGGGAGWCWVLLAAGQRREKILYGKSGIMPRTHLAMGSRKRRTDVTIFLVSFPLLLRFFLTGWGHTTKSQQITYHKPQTTPENA